MAPIIPAPKIIFELRAELLGDGYVLDEDAVFAVGVVGGERGGRDVLGDPGWVARAPVVGGG